MGNPRTEYYGGGENNGGKSQEGLATDKSDQVGHLWKCLHCDCFPVVNCGTGKAVLRR